VKSNRQYIACQSPLQNTSEDFWDMIIQYKITKIVMLNQFEDNNYLQSVRILKYLWNIILFIIE
jgi:protein tyrosine phosphatase